MEKDGTASKLLLAAIAEKESLVAERDAAVAAQAGYAKVVGAKEKQASCTRRRLHPRVSCPARVVLRAPRPARVCLTSPLLPPQVVALRMQA